MTKIYVTEWKGQNPVAYHVFELPGLLDKGGYTSGVSLSAFRGRENMRLYEAQTKGKGSHKKLHRCSVDYGEDNVTGNWMRKNIPLPTHEHASLWDFYKAVGYDYKRKRYVK